MPLELSLDDNDHRFQNIETFVKKYLEVVQYTAAIPFESRQTHEDDMRQLYDKLAPYDATQDLNIITGWSGWSGIDTNQQKNNLFRKSLIFCELIFFDRINWNEKTIGKFDDFKKNFTFAKSQLPEIKQLLEPFTKTHQLMYVLSELDAINNDINNTQNNLTISETQAISYTTINYFTKNDAYTSEVAKWPSTNPLAHVISFINDTTIMHEVSEYPRHHDIEQMPDLIAKVNTIYPKNTAEFTMPTIKYLEHITISPEIN